METSLAVAELEPLALIEARPIDRNAAAVYLSGLASVGSRRVMRSDLDTIAGLLTGGRCNAFTIDWARLRFQHVAAVRAALDERYTYTGANRMLSALRGVLKAAWRLGQLPTDEYTRAVDVPSIKGESLPRGRALSSGELRSLFSVCSEDKTPAGRRDAAILALLYGAGLRRSEVVALDVADYELGTGEVTVRHGKGNKERLVYATNGSRAALEAWLSVRGEGDGPLFVGITSGGRILCDRLNSQVIFRLLAKRAGQAGISNVSPHDFRRTFISHLLDAGADIVTVQKMAGHANVQTTARYDRRGEAAKIKAAELLHIPYGA